MATSKIRIKRGTSQEIANSTAILPLGTPFYDTTNKYLYISNGEKAANLHECITTDRVETPNFITKQTDAHLTISAINNSEDYIKIGELTPHRLSTAPTVQLFSKVFVQDETLALVKEYNDLTITPTGITINHWNGDSIQYSTLITPSQIETSGIIKGNISGDSTINGKSISNILGRLNQAETNIENIITGETIVASARTDEEENNIYDTYTRKPVDVPRAINPNGDTTVRFIITKPGLYAIHVDNSASIHNSAVFSIDDLGDDANGPEIFVTSGTTLRVFYNAASATKDGMITITPNGDYEDWVITSCKLLIEYK